MRRAFTLIAWGLFKKTCMADNLGLIVAKTGQAAQQSNAGSLGCI
jgi:alginate O-acetyltransferase complex protein AlgI